MKIEELKSMMEDVVDAKLAPVLETQKKYNFDGQQEAPAATESKGETLEAGLRVARFAKCLVLSKNDPDKALFYAKGAIAQGTKGMYPNDTQLHNAFKALSVSTPSEGGFTVPIEMVNEMIPLLYAQTAVRELGARTIPMSNGNLNIPKITGGSVSYYDGENRAATKSQQTFGSVKFSSKKLLTFVPTSNDLIRNSSIEADRYIRDDMIQQTKLKMDYTAFYGAGTEFAPIGIKNVTGISKTSVSAVIGADDPGTMMGILMSKNLPMTSVGWAFNGTVWAVLYNLKTSTGAYIYRDEMKEGKLLGKPFVVTNQIATGADAHGLSDIFLGDFSEFIVAEELGLEMTASQEASYDNGNGSIISTFQNDQTVIRLLAKHDFNIRHAEAFICNTYYTK
jgi:HK97 family phage major capsid protein